MLPAADAASGRIFDANKIGELSGFVKVKNETDALSIRIDF